jgi:hypothetical protein
MPKLYMLGLGQTACVELVGRNNSAAKWVADVRRPLAGILKK